MSFELSEPSVNLFDGSNWKRLGRFLGANLYVFIVLSLIINLLVYPILGDTWVSLLITIAVIIMGQSYVLGLYEKWQGCQFKNENNN